MIKKSIMIIILSSFACGCSTLDDGTVYGSQCGSHASLAYVFMKTHAGKASECTADDEACQDYAHALKTLRCPENYNLCSTDINGMQFCHQTRECPTNMHPIQDGTCQADDLQNCGSQGNSCGAATDIRTPQCIDGQCKISCATGYKPDIETLQCVEFTESCDGENLRLCGSCVDISSNTSHCGDCNFSCAEQFGNNINEVSCSNKQCKLLSCNSGYHLNADSTQCLDDDVSACGSNNCTLLNGWNGGSCSNGQCIASSCEPGYHLDGIACKLNTQSACGSPNNDCSNNPEATMCDPAKGECVNTCPTPQVQCGSSCSSLNDIDNCGTCGNACDSIIGTGGISHTACADKKCIPTACEKGYHLTNDVCEKDDDSNCGGSGITCSTEDILNSAQVKCQNGTCTVTQCADKYHIYKNQCEQDSTANCGDHDIKCNAANAQNTCTDGKCKYTCNAGYHDYTGACDEKDDIDNCGSHGTKCAVANAKNLCTNRKCAFACNPGYHEYSGQCEIDDISNCGSHGRTCTSTQSCCNSGCSDLIDNDNCGKCGQTCTPSKISNSLAVSCSTGTCIATKCAFDYTVTLGRCMPVQHQCNSSAECGSGGLCCLVDGVRRCMSSSDSRLKICMPSEPQI